MQQGVPPSPTTEELAAQASDYREFVAPAERRRVMVASLLAAALVPSFGLLDAIVYPGLLWNLVLMRLGLSAVALATAVAVHFARRYWTITAISSVLVFAMGCGIAVMALYVGGHRSPYYAGANLALVGAAALFTLPVWLAALEVAAVLLSYLLPVLLLETRIDVPVLVAHSFFLGATGSIAVASAWIRNRLAIQQFESTQALARSHEKLRELHQLKDQLFQNISHEFRTPLALILAPVESMMETAGPESRKPLQTVRDNALRLLNLINDLLDLAKLDAVGISAQRRPLAPGVLLRQIGEGAEDLAGRQQLTLHLEIASGIPAYQLDERHLEKVVLNLLSNAFKFTPAGGQVWLRASEHADAGLRIEVEDTGPGIPADAQSGVFERFRQLDGSSTRRYGGTGIGLALVKELTELNGGAIAVRSEVGKGSCFSLNFPPSCRSAPEAVPEALGAPAASPGISAMSRRAAFASLEVERRSDVVARAGTRGPKVLVAEDDPGLLRQLTQLLADRYQVAAVGNGRLALDEAIGQKPHLIITDLMMPEMDGLQLVAALRDLPAMRDTPIVMLSAKAEVKDRIAGRELGIDTYLTKPFHPGELLASVQGLLRSRQRVMGPYVLHAPLGSGGQSEIYLAERADDSRPAALKVLTTSTSLDPKARDRLAREAKALASLRHPNVVRLLDHGTEEGQTWLAMELLNGATVRDVLDASGPLAPGSAAQVTAALADALQAVHEAELVHRDVKCENVMLLRSGQGLRERVRLIDFGIVRDKRSLTLTAAGKVVGTLCYLAPEVLAGEEATPASDIYAAGVSLYTMCTGVLPFRQSGSDEAVQAILGGERERASHLRPEVPPALDEIINRAMAVDAAKRFASAAELRDALLGLGLEAGPVLLPDDASSAEDVLRTREVTESQVAMGRR